MSVQRQERWEHPPPRRRLPRVGLSGPVAAFGGILLLVGCASSTGGTTDTGSTVTVLTGDGVSYALDRAPETRLDQPVTRTPGDAWLALPGVYRALGFDVDTRVDSRRELGTSQHRFSRQILNRRASDFFDCGTDPGLMRPLADQVPIDARVVTSIMAGEGGAARIRTEVSATARRTGGAAGRADCRSTGLLELLIARMVEDGAG